MKFFEPFRDPGVAVARRPSSSVPPESDPASASVRPQAPSHSPRASFGTYLRRCSSVPNW